jgi:ADP-ribose pyrophosphatase
MEIKKIRTLSRKTILDKGKYLTVEDHTIAFPDGTIITGWPWVITPDFVNIIAVNRSGNVMIFNQAKYGLDEPSLAAIGGYIEPGEDPLSAACRELLEETGFEADEWHPLGKYQVDGNRGAGHAHLFLALGVHKVAQVNRDDIEPMELIELTREEFKRTVLENLNNPRFKVLPWATAASLSLLYMQDILD